MREVHRFLVENRTHEQAEDRQLYPVLARVLGGNDPTANDEPHPRRDRPPHPHAPAASSTASTRTDPSADDIIELRRLLYGLHAILELHFAQEDEGYLSLVDDDSVLEQSIP